MSFIRGIFSRWFPPAAQSSGGPAGIQADDAPSSTSSYQLAGTTKKEIYRKLVASVDRAPTRTKIDVIKEFVSSPVMGDKRVVGDLFESLFTHGTAEEWREEIYPGLLSIIHDTSVNHPDVVSKRAFLAWLVKGIMSQS
jgi:hypothetical protein